jgi:hypothetical protein
MFILYKNLSIHYIIQYINTLYNIPYEYPLVYNVWYRVLYNKHTVYRSPCMVSVVAHLWPNTLALYFASASPSILWDNHFFVGTILGTLKQCFLLKTLLLLSKRCYFTQTLLSR